tara:strand:- start:254 stop:616 length:363 start_codon:yes stop_codon:yes gene_type:complete
MYGDDFEPVMQMSKNAFFLQGIADEAQAKVAELKAAEVVDLEEIKKAMNEARTLLKEVNSEWDRVAKYVTPQLKAQEVTFPEGIEVKAKPESDIELTRKLAFILSRAAIAKASEESKETF